MGSAVKVYHYLIHRYIGTPSKPNVQCFDILIEDRDSHVSYALLHKHMGLDGCRGTYSHRKHILSETIIKGDTSYLCFSTSFCTKQLHEVNALSGRIIGRLSLINSCVKKYNKFVLYLHCFLLGSIVDFLLPTVWTLFSALCLFYPKHRHRVHAHNF